MSVAELVELAKGGDETAFEELYQKTLPLLFREVSRYFSSEEDREDALQETYLKIFEKMDSIREPEKFSGWALVICSRVCLNRIRWAEGHLSKEELRPETSAEDEPGLDVLAADELKKELNPDAHVNAAHVSEVVTRVLDALPTDQRDCLLLWMQGYSSVEIAEELNLNASTVRSNISYAKKKVSKTLKKMQREGTFDYRELSTDPVAAFLALLERFLGTSFAVSGLTGEAIPVVRHPVTSVLAIVLAVALAIGVAVALQAFSGRQPATRDAQQTTAPVVERVPETTESPETAPATEQGGPGNAPVAPTPTPAPVPTPAPGTGGGAANAGQNAPAANAATNLLRPDGRLTAFQTTDAEGVTPNTVTNAEQTLTGGLTRLTNNYSSFAMTFDSLGKEDGLVTVNLFFGNYTGHPAKILEITDISVRNADGELIAKRASFVPDKEQIVGPGEEIRMKLPFPDSFITKENLPKMKSSTLYEDAGVNVYGRVNYVLSGDIEDFTAVEISELPPLTKPYPQSYPNQQNVLVYVRDMVEEGDNILCYMGVQNDTKATMTVDRFEYIRFYGVDDRTRAEGRVKFPKNFTLKPGEERYLLVTIPKASYDNFSLLNSIGHLEDVIYTLYY